MLQKIKGMWYKQLMVISLLITVFTKAYAQEELSLSAKDSVVTSSWIFGIGFTIVDDSGDVFDNLLEVNDTWNAVPYPSRISIGRYFKSGIGVEAIASYSIYKEGKRVDGLFLTEDKPYYAIDSRLSYDLNKIIGQTGWFDPYVGGGIGYTSANDQGRSTYNAVVGFRTWFTDRLGLDLNSSGKWAMNKGNGITNHLQHAIGVVYQFDYEKGLSKKGLEKQAVIEEIIKENTRIKDSIASAQKAEDDAKKLADQLAKEKVLKAEKDELLAAQVRRNTIEEAINSLSKVYFDLNSSYLTPSSKVVLSKLAEILKENPTAQIEISCYTDARGTSAYNTWLSDRRVKRTVAFVLERGVPLRQIEGKAFGEEILVNECKDGVYCPEEKHKENRRSEFKLINF